MDGPIAVHAVLPGAALTFYAERMLDLDRINVEEIAAGLADQTDYEHRATGERWALPAPV